jgi:pimeloyl-ACP methyl ester carboxylesterase
VQRAPCIVFLHGFGGELSIYLRTMVDSELGKRFVIVAPVLDNLGIWSSRRGFDVIARTLDTLPPEADRQRVVLVGLSNGSIGVSAVLQDPALRGRFTGFVLLSGAGQVYETSGLHGIRALAISGRQDPRFPFSYIESSMQALGSAGAQVELLGLNADHFLILTHASEWTGRVAALYGQVPLE